MQLLGVDVVFNHADYRLMSRKMVDAVLEMSEYNRFFQRNFRMGRLSHRMAGI